MGGPVANSEHTEILRRGPRAWNAWRQDNPSHIPNLDDAVLSLSERQMGPINGGPINLSGDRMRRAFFRSANLWGGDLECADLSTTVPMPAWTEPTSRVSICRVRSLTMRTLMARC